MRKAAISAAVFSAVGVLFPIPSAISSVRQLPGVWKALPLGIAALIVDTLFPVFCAAIFFNRNGFRVPGNLRFLARAAGFLLVLTVMLSDKAFGTAGWFWTDAERLVISVRIKQLLNVGNLSGMMYSTGVLAAKLASIIYGVMLVGLSRIDAGSAAPPPEWFSTITRIATAVWGLISIGCVVRLFFMPFVYSSLNHLALSNGVTPPGNAEIIRHEIGTFVPWLCLFAGAYIVYRGLQPAKSAQVTPPAE